MQNNLLDLYLDWIPTRHRLAHTIVRKERSMLPIGNITVEDILSKDKSASIVVVRHAIIFDMFNRLMPLLNKPAKCYEVIAKNIGSHRETVGDAVTAFNNKLSVKDIFAVDAHNSLNEYLETVGKDYSNRVII
jgi:signal-transduction protein with cAMP-binding, CBS, and nucleotidyltransferase domain